MNKVLWAIAMLVCSACACADSSAINATLSVHKVALDASGKEVTAIANDAKPGELLEYAAEYVNTSKSGVTQLAITIPIPQGTEYVGSDKTPPNMTASVDGRSFHSLPLKQKVRGAHGKEIEQILPTSAYRFVRWNHVALAAGESIVFRARVRVKSDDVVANR